MHMRVLMISGDHNLTREGTSAHERFLLQKNSVEVLELVVWPAQFWKPFFISGPFDVVTSQDPFWRGLVAWIAAKRLGALLNVQVHADLNAQSLVKHVLAHIVLRHASSVRAVSHTVASQAAHITRAPVSVLPIFIDGKKFSGISHEPHPTFASTILWIGRFEDEKDPLLALEVLRQVRALGTDAGLVMLGDGSLKKALARKAQTLGLASYVEFPGWQDPLKYLSRSDVVLCTSQAESFGASLVEALAAGAAVVSLDVGVAREAGAIIAKKAELAEKTAHALQMRATGSLASPLLSQEEWVASWRKTLE